MVTCSGVPVKGPFTNLPLMRPLQTLLTTMGQQYIGINKTVGGKRYVKDVAFRYAQEDNETVKMFVINSNCWLTNVALASESKLLADSDGRTNDVNTDKVLKLIIYCLNCLYFLYGFLYGV